jgi:hypothetical protein
VYHPQQNNNDRLQMIGRNVKCINESDEFNNKEMSHLSIVASIIKTEVYSFSSKCIYEIGMLSMQADYVERARR